MPATSVVTFMPLRSRDGSPRAFTLLDHEDYERFNHRRYSLLNSRYAVRGGSHNGRKQPLLLHREILGLAPGDTREGDHINRDTLDNRRANLRVVSRSGNAQNYPAVGGTSAHRGVSWHAASHRWRADVQLSGRQRHLGYFASEDEAAEAAARFRAEHMPYSEDAA